VSFTAPPPPPLLLGLAPPPHTSRPVAERRRASASSAPPLLRRLASHRRPASLRRSWPPGFFSVAGYAREEGGAAARRSRSRVRSTFFNSSISRSSRCVLRRFVGSDGRVVPGSAAASADPPPASRQSPRALAKAGASSRCSTKAVAPLWERLCPKAKRYLSAEGFSALKRALSAAFWNPASNIYVNKIYNCNRAPPPSLFELCNLLRAKDLLHDCIHSFVEEQVAMFVHVLTHGQLYLL